ncbi:ABC transporter permease, partial [Parageobacillus sp. SY1]
PPSITYIYKSYEDSEFIAAVSQRIQQAYIMKVIDESKADPEIVNKLLTPVKIKKEAIKDTRETFGIVYSFVFLMYIFIATFGQMIASSIASEKSSRVIEVIISKVKPIYMMYAKILAILFAGLTQFFIIMLAFGTSYLLGWFDSDGLSIFGLNINLQNLSLFVIVSFLISFILGFLLYALLYAAVGATVSRTEDLSSGLLPIIILVMCALFIGMKSLFNPSSDIVVISSYIPVFSPIVTFSRIMVGEAGYGEIGLTLLLLVCSIFFMNRLVSIIYVNSVTNYRGKLKMKELVQVVRKGIEM